MGKAGHHEQESYILIKPDLPDIAKSLIKIMSGEMPQGRHFLMRGCL